MFYLTVLHELDLPMITVMFFNLSVSFFNVLSVDVIFLLYCRDSKVIS